MIAVLAMTTAAPADIITSTCKVVEGVRTPDTGPTVNVLIPSYVQDEEEMIPDIQFCYESKRPLKTDSVPKG